jgi:hypothetical protein
MFDAFSKIDGNGFGKDRRIDLGKWMRGFRGVTDHGFVALQGIASNDEAADVFKMMDDNGGGIVLLDEWCKFLKDCEIIMDTPLGRLLNAGQYPAKNGSLFAHKMEKSKAKVPSDALATWTLSQKSLKAKQVTHWQHDTIVNPKSYLKSGNGAHSALIQDHSKPAGRSQDDLRTWLQGWPSSGCFAAPLNAFGLALGKHVSEDLLRFISVFEPFLAKTEQGEQLRAEGFLAADPNGNGLCSLAELETFVLRELLSSFPNRGKGAERTTPGHDLFKTFRPCYIRAFKDAADFANDDNSVIEGTKDATQDDFVSKDEFVYFCLYVCVYASMVNDCFMSNPPYYRTYCSK